MTGSGDQPPNPWWLAQVDRRLAEIDARIEAIWREVRDDARRGDGHGSSLTWLDRRVEDLRKDVEAVRTSIRLELMTREDFAPYKKGIILLITTVMLAVVGALLKLVILAH